MANAYVATAFKDAGGSHGIGEQIALPDETGADRAAFSAMIHWGLISTDRPAGGDEDPSSALAAALEDGAAQARVDEAERVQHEPERDVQPDKRSRRGQPKAD